jgi:L-threonylcarbamoyladenylate synthase
MTKSEAIQEAVEQLKKGNLILCPTDSIYGISCDATNEVAVQKLIELKGRSSEKSFIVLINSDRMVNQCFKDTPEVVWDMIDLSEKPLTVVMEGGQYVAKSVLNQDGSLGMRSVKSGSIHEILRKFNRPIVSTSPNISGQSTPMTLNEIDESIKSAVDFVFPEFSDEKMSGMPSKIIRIRPNGEVNILRK